MKIEKFLECVQTKMLNYPDVHFRTLKLFFDNFVKCLSKRERERWMISLQMITEFSSKQISLTEFVNQEITNDLVSEITKLKKEGKKK